MHGFVIKMATDHIQSLEVADNGDECYILLVCEYLVIGNILYKLNFVIFVVYLRLGVRYWV